MRTNWSQQSERLFAFLKEFPNQDWEAPYLNSIAAGEGRTYCASFTKRISECRSKAAALGWQLILSKDEWHGKQRQTAYRLVVP